MDMKSLLRSIPSDHLKKMGVEVLLNTRVENIEHNKVSTSNGIIDSANIIWAAGNKTSSLIDKLNTKQDKSGRAIVNDDLTIEDFENIFVIGDAALVNDKKGNPIPAIAPAAMQQGKFVAKLLKNIKKSVKKPKFLYWDKGMMATIGRAKAIVQFAGFKFSGFFAWIMWGIVHIFFLIDFRNRLKVMLEWVWYYITFKPGAHLIFHNSNQQSNKITNK